MSNYTNNPNLPNWFESVKFNFENMLLPLKGKELRILQLGAYAGDASIWLLENVLTHPKSLLVDVDIWELTDQVAYQGINWNEVENQYDLKCVSSNKILKCKGRTTEFLRESNEKYDFIYIDADHEASSVLSDAVHSWPLLNSGGIMVFDDYQWDQGKGALHNPKLAIDIFLNIFARELRVVVENWQIWVQKLPVG